METHRAENGVVVDQGFTQNSTTTRPLPEIGKDGVNVRGEIEKGWGNELRELFLQQGALPSMANIMHIQQIMLGIKAMFIHRH